MEFIVSAHESKIQKAFTFYNILIVLALFSYLILQLSMAYHHAERGGSGVTPTKAKMNKKNHKTLKILGDNVYISFS